MFREVFKDLQNFSPDKFYFSNIDLTELDKNITKNRLFRNEQFFQYNSYNHTFYTCIKFVDFIYHDISKNYQKGILIITINFKIIFHLFIFIQEIHLKIIEKISIQ